MYDKAAYDKIKNMKYAFSSQSRKGTPFLKYFVMSIFIGKRSIHNKTSPQRRR